MATASYRGGRARTGAALARVRLPIALTLACVTGCAPHGRPTLEVIARAVAEDPRIEVDPERLLAARIAAEVATEDVLPCTAAPEARPGGWSVRCPAPPVPRAWRLVADLAGLLQARLRITSADAECAGAFRFEARRLPGRGESERYLAPLPERRPQCADAPMRLELRGVGPLGTDARLLGVSLSRIPPEELLPDAGKPARIRLRKDWRVGFVDRAVLPIPRLTPAPEGAELRVATAVVGDAPCWLEARHETAGASTVLFTREIAGVEADPAPEWVDIAVALAASQLAGGQIALAASCDADRGTSLVLWGDPRLLAVRDRSGPPNFLLISIDTLRADRLGAYGNPRPTSPHLDRWFAREAALFEQATAPAPWTYPSHVSMLTGVDAVRHGAYFGDQPIDLRPLAPLALRLGGLGYTTLAVTGGGYVDGELGFASGFQLYRSWTDPARRDRELEENLAFLDGRIDGGLPEPFFLFLHTYEVHPPNPARQPYFSVLSALPADLEVVDDPELGASPDNGFVRGSGARLLAADGTTSPLPPELSALPFDLYDSAIAYMDERLAALLERLGDRGLLDDTVVVFTSDHGESLGELGHWGHGNLDEPNLRVPLAVRLPGGRGAGRRVAAPVRLTDIVPTLLELVGRTVPETDGESLLPLLANGPQRPPRTAWAYAASNNQGLALRQPGRRKLVLFDAAWPPIAGRIDSFDLVGDGERPEAIDVETATAFRRRASEKLERDLVGVHIAVESLSSRPRHLEIRQGYLGPSTIKLLHPGPTVAWRGPGRVGLTVPARGTARLVLLRADPSELDIGLALEDDECRSPRAQVVARVALAPDEVRELRLPCRGEGEGDGLIVRLRAPGPGPESTAPLSEVLERELRALGYLR